MDPKNRSKITQKSTKNRPKIDAKKRTTDNQFDVIVKLRVDSKSKNTDNVLFVLELDYGGVFQIENIPDD